MLQVNWSIVNKIHLKGNRFVTGGKIKATVISKLNDSLGLCHHLHGWLADDAKLNLDKSHYTCNSQTC